jgi:transposase
MWLESPFLIEPKIIEENPEPQPVMIIEYKIAHYKCPRFRKEVIAKDANCPHEGKFGNNIIAQATILKYLDRLPQRKIQDTLKRLHGLKISPATILNLTRRAAEVVQMDYNQILNRIQNANG